MTADSSLPLFANDGTVAALAKLDRKLGPNLDYAHAKRQLEFLRGMRMMPEPRSVDPAAWIFSSLSTLFAPPPLPTPKEFKPEDEIPMTCLACEDNTCDFKVTEMRRRPVGDLDVLIEVLYCGVCHSDLTNAAAHLPGQMQYPMVPGHEAVGKVTKVGPGVTKVKAGDHVGVGNLVDSCQTCSSCVDSSEQWCSKAVNTFNGVDWSGRAATGGNVPYTLGGFSTQMVVTESFVIKIPPSYPLEYAGPVMCAGTTVYAPLKEAGVGPGTSVAVVGLGGLGVMAIKLAKALGCTVIAISRGEAKHALAMRVGADTYVPSSDAEQMAAVAGTIDLVLNFIPANHDPAVYTKLLTPTGQQVHVGLHAAAITAGSVNFLLPGRTRERFSFIGGISTTQEVMDLAASANIRTEIDLRPAGDINRIFEALDASNETGARYVIDIAGTLTPTSSTSPSTTLAIHPPAEALLQDVASGIASKLSEFVDSSARVVPRRPTPPLTPPTTPTQASAGDAPARTPIGRLLNKLFFDGAFSE